MGLMLTKKEVGQPSQILESIGALVKSFAHSQVQAPIVTLIDIVYGQSSWWRGGLMVSIPM
jgi:hypothetical protein